MSDAFAREPGGGTINLGLSARPDAVGGSLDFGYRLSDKVAAYAGGWLGMSRDIAGWRQDWLAQVGIKGEW